MGDWFGRRTAAAAVELARTRFERGFALLVRNSRIGSGNDGFDLDELPWSAEGEDEGEDEQAFCSGGCGVRTVPGPRVVPG
ncbi:hypothetical protein ABZX12_09745 [Kribbella sp. NPDC003505]|uniref:hypothetical protein n=1 Tax=Kribbella sp. NPDC003505 TaxID=3154448 RepID=UPI00339ED93A